MRAGVAPVLLSDKYELPAHVDWPSFLLRFPEKDIARLPRLLEPHLKSAPQRGRLARAAWEKHFAEDKEFDAIVAGCAEALRNSVPVEATFQPQQRKMIAGLARRQQLRSFARSSVLKTLKLLGLKNPYRMNR